MKGKADCHRYSNKAAETYDTMVWDHDILYKSGEPCSHLGCLNHRKSHCEGCGRKGGEGRILKRSIK
ncbi:MAG: hypothetical protein PF495_15135 [Spirochaetales bacterium]|jgi:hypothetical protein|nr:hypothetical protein [Spirochaetales bacterium]